MLFYNLVNTMANKSNASLNQIMPLLNSQPMKTVGESTSSQPTTPSPSFIIWIGKQMTLLCQCLISIPVEMKLPAFSKMYLKWLHGYSVLEGCEAHVKSLLKSKKHRRSI